MDLHHHYFCLRALPLPHSHLLRMEGEDGEEVEGGLQTFPGSPAPHHTEASRQASFLSTPSLLI